MTRWRPSSFLVACAAIHLLALLLMLIDRGLWPWSVGMLVLNHLSIMAISLWPRSTLLGPNLVRLPRAAVERHEIAITIDDGPNPAVTPRVLSILAEHGAHATFFCIGSQARLYPHICREIIQAGHSLQNHGQTHATFCALMGAAGWRREVGEAQKTIRDITASEPVFYRAVAGLRNPFLAPVLHSLGLSLASWTRRGYDTVEGDADTVLARLTKNLAAGDILLLHDGHCAHTRDGQPVIIAVLPRLLARIAEQKLKPVTLVNACTPH